MHSFPNQISILIIQHVRIVATHAHATRADFNVFVPRIKRDEAVIHAQTKLDIFVRHVGQGGDLFLHFRRGLVFAQIQVEVVDSTGRAFRSVEVTLDSSENHV